MSAGAAPGGASAKPLARLRGAGAASRAGLGLLRCRRRAGERERGLGDGDSLRWERAWRCPAPPGCLRPRPELDIDP